ncbi:MFS monocarboxylate transporter [Trichophyton interdigitale]|uniref:MFS monocarboxylate transporter n=1 Tax=Trichophyton interdigitale TaxID=101480 RepID=A0A9P4YI01_9EURO|nr:MFS monocarboxylate transporter [Trichophyton interdigitale]KAF3898163.1 MFS monocarboxylate transporter [Trichophyton interdigitale]KAG8211651.1 MFS monocarboxylate transporter [Trichophyton interdigitale]
MGEPTDKTNPEVRTTIVADGTPVQLGATGDTDQGLRAWTVVVGAWCVNLCGFGWVNAIGVFQEYYQSHQLQSYSTSSISWILSLQPFVLFAAGLIIGRIFDNYGPKLLLLVGTVLQVLGLMMTSISNEYYQFILAQGICGSLGASLTFYSSIASTATWFDKRRALAFGLVSSGSSFGGAIFPIILSRLLPGIGFGWTLRVVGFLVFVLLVVANLTIRSRVTPVPRPVRFHDYISPFSEVPFVLLTVGSCLGFFATFVPINYVILEAQTSGVDPNLAGYLLTILNAASLPGRILPGYLGDIWGRFNVMIGMCGLSSVAILALWLPGTLVNPGSAAIYTVFCLLYGFFSGAFVGMVPALLSQVSPDVSKIGVRQGVLFTCVSVATLTGNPIAGAILNQQNGAYWGLQIFAGLMMTGCVVFYIIARVVTGGYSLIKAV